MSHWREFPDGKRRCSWVTEDVEYIRYHDVEWGTKTEGQIPLFEAICLEGFQAGLSWLTILRRRGAFRSAFFGFDPARLANLDQSFIEQQLQNKEIIRNRAKIASAINNAQVVQQKGLDLTDLLWSFAPQNFEATEADFEWKVVSSDSIALSKELKRLGFSFVGPTTMYALMQSTGMIFDHSPNCFRSQ